MERALARGRASQSMPMVYFLDILTSLVDCPAVTALLSGIGEGHRSAVGTAMAARAVRGGSETTKLAWTQPPSFARKLGRISPLANPVWSRPCQEPWS